MSDKKISELPLASTINPDDVSVLVNNGADYQFAFTTLLQFIGSNLIVGADMSFGTTLPQNTVGKNGDIFINTNTGAFAKKTSGTWMVVFTLPSTDSLTDGTVLYGLGVPGTGLGKNNDTYINTGTGIFYKKSADAWGQVFSMQTGPQGPQGTAGTKGMDGINGNTILSGTIAPSNLSDGVDGDYYINKLTFVIYGPKQSGVWPAGASLIPEGIPFGGTIAQVLVKNSNDDFDTKWFSLEEVYEQLSNKGVANGYAPLNSSTKVDPLYLPSYVSDIITVDNFANLPNPGTPGFIYITKDTNFEYRWNDGTSAYIRLVASPGTTDALAEGSVNLYYTNARVKAYTDTLYVNGTTNQFGIGGNKQWTGNAQFSGGASFDGGQECDFGTPTVHANVFKNGSPLFNLTENDARYFKLTGGTLTGGINVGENNIVTNWAILAGGSLGVGTPYTRLGSSTDYLQTFNGDTIGTAGWKFHSGLDELQIRYDPSRINDRFGVYYIVGGDGPLIGDLAYTSDITSSISGITNYLPKYTASHAIGTSLIYDDGSKIAVGTATSAGGLLNLLSTTEQLRLSYDASHYTAFTVNTAGNLTIAPIGTALIIQGSTGMFGRNTVQMVGEQLRLQSDATNYTQFLVSAGGMLSVFPSGGQTTLNGSLIATRNVADAVAVLTVNQVNGSATGNIQNWQFTGSTLAFVDKAGSFSSAGWFITGQGLKNSTNANNSYVNVGTAGTIISRNIADANPALLVNQINASSTGPIQSWQFGGVTKATIDISGLLRAASIANLSATNNSRLIFNNSGLLADRNINDANTAFTINNILGTGLIADFQFGGVSKASIDRFGNIISNNINVATGAFSGIVTINNQFISATNLGGVSLSSFVASNDFGKLLIGQNRSSGSGEVNYVSFAGTGSVAFGGHKFSVVNTSGAETILLDLAGDNATFHGRVIPGIVDASSAVGNLFAQYDASTQALVSRTNAQTRSDLNVPIGGHYDTDAGLGETTFTVTFSSVGTSDYRASITETLGEGTGSYYITNKTNTSFDVVYKIAQDGVIAFDWFLQLN